MNELQQVLIVFAIIVIVGLYFLQKRKSSKSDSVKSTHQSIPQSDDTSSPKSPASRQQAEKALNNLGEPHIPVSVQTHQRLQINDEDKVPENQLGLSFGEGFENPKSVEPEIRGGVGIEDQAIEATGSTEPAHQDENAEVKRKPKHVVIQDEAMVAIEEFVTVGSALKEDMPSFGVPSEASNTSVDISLKKSNVEKTEPEVFALIVMGTSEFLWPKVNQTLQGVGLVASESQIFVKKDSMGNEIIRVANLLEPGTFPIEEPTNNDNKVPGVVLILELPTTVKAPAVMHDMIMMARKISQRLNGRLYNIERHLIKESDLQQMRDTAVAYESQAL